MTENQIENRKRRAEMAALTRQGWTVTRIAEKYGVSKQAISQLLQKAAKEGEIVVKTKSHLTKKDKYNENVVLVVRKKYKKCVICNKKYETNQKKTCSEKCKHELQSKKIGGKWSRHEFMTLECCGCNKKFQRSNYIQSITSKRRKSDNYYCSHECYLKNSPFLKTKSL